jgi:hypothetical protein
MSPDLVSGRGFFSGIYLIAILKIWFRLRDRMKTSEVIKRLYFLEYKLQHRTIPFKWAFLIGALVLALVIPGTCFAKELILVAEPALQSTVPAAPAPEAQKNVLNWETRAGRSYIIPGLEIIGFLVILNQFDRHFSEPEDVYHSGTNSSWANLNGSNKWIVDTDPFSTNQFLHPYQGSIYYGLARSAGLNFWESFLYAEVGSFIWEIAGETGAPSINDQITTPIGGSFLGEPLFRMANLLLESGNGKPGFWRELGAAVISPPTGVNRLVFGDRFDAVFPSHDPAVFMRLQLGYSLSTSLTGPAESQDFEPHQAIGDFAMAYGLPGKPGYHYTRPFDYFHFEFTAATSTIFENIMVRGLLIGTDYASGTTYRGVWGLYGSYDYIAPQTFRVSSSALSLGTTAQWWLSEAVALQGTALAGLGYGAAGTIHGSGERDYHYGLTPQGLLALRLLLGDRASIDMTLREYYVSGTFSTEDRGSETIFRGDAAATLRVYKNNAVALKYIASTRDGHYPDLPNTHQAVGTIILAYTFLSDFKFGVVEWPNP